jgi:plastocyanin
MPDEKYRESPDIMTRAAFCLIATLLSVCTWPGAGAEVAGKIILQKKVRRTVVAPGVYNLRAGAVDSASPGPRGTSPFGRVAVWLEPYQAESVTPITTTIEQRNHRFEPELVIVPKGSAVEFPNLDLVFHNIFSLSGARAFDLGYYPKGQSRQVTFPRAGVVQVYCHVHSNMYAAIVVVPSHWAAQPATDGSFGWPDVPPGKYRLMAWQRFGGLYRRELTVQASPVHITLTIPEEEEPDKR